MDDSPQETEVETIPPDPDKRPLPGQHGVEAGSVHLLAQPIGGLVRAGDLERREVVYASASTEQEERRLLGTDEPTGACSFQEGSCSKGHGVGGHRGRKMSPRLLSDCYRLLSRRKQYPWPPDLSCLDFSFWPQATQEVAERMPETLNEVKAIVEGVARRMDGDQLRRMSRHTRRRASSAARKGEGTSSTSCRRYKCRSRLLIV